MSKNPVIPKNKHVTVQAGARRKTATCQPLYTMMERHNVGCVTTITSEDIAQRALTMKCMTTVVAWEF
jgi:hypothetical protein